MLPNSDITIELTEEQIRNMIINSMISSQDQKVREQFISFVSIDVQIANERTLRVSMSIDPRILTLSLPPQAKNVVVSSNRISISFDVDLYDILAEEINRGVRIVSVDPDRGVIKLAIPIGAIAPIVPGVVPMMPQQMTQQIINQLAQQVVQQHTQPPQQQQRSRIVTK